MQLMNELSCFLVRVFGLEVAAEETPPSVVTPPLFFETATHPKNR
jgi:hypothetical protein